MRLAVLWGMQSHKAEYRKAEYCPARLVKMPYEITCNSMQGVLGQ